MWLLSKFNEFKFLLFHKPKYSKFGLLLKFKLFKLTVDILIFLNLWLLVKFILFIIALFADPYVLNSSNSVKADKSISFM